MEDERSVAVATLALALGVVIRTRPPTPMSEMPNEFLNSPERLLQGVGKKDHDYVLILIFTVGVSSAVTSLWY